MTLNTVFLGAPGVGKGTMAKMLAQRLGVRHISTGDLLREHMKKGSEMGRAARAYVESGQLVPDEVVAGLVKNTLAEDCKGDGGQGFVLDGFPRTLEQGKLLDEVLEEAGMSLHYAVLFEAEQHTLITRLAERRICKQCGALYNNTFTPPRTPGKCDLCGGELYQRTDDNEDTVRERLQVFERQTTPLIRFYEERNILLRVPGDREVEENFAELRKALRL